MACGGAVTGGIVGVTDTLLLQAVKFKHAPTVGGSTVAVFTSVPVAVAVTEAVTVIVAVADAGTVQLVATLPVPLDGEQFGADQLVNATPAGALSDRRASSASTLAALVMTKVYVIAVTACAL